MFTGFCRQAVEEGGSGATWHGPVTQTHFLRSLGIDARLEALQAAATPEDAAQLRAGYERCVGLIILIRLKIPHVSHMLIFVHRSVEQHYRALDCIEHKLSRWRSCQIAVM